MAIVTVIGADMDTSNKNRRPKITKVKYTRKGFCDYVTCEALCCRSLNVENAFIKNDNDSNRMIPCAGYRCPNIGKDFKCKVYTKRPTVCEEFPVSPWSTLYRRVQAECSYWFEVEIIYMETLTSEIPSPSPSPDSDTNVAPNSGG